MEAVHQGKWYETVVWYTAVRNEAIRRLFRGEDIGNEIVVKLMEISMPNEFNQRIKSVNGSKHSEGKSN